LIPSHRHKPEDLELWAELEAADAVAPIAASVADAVRQVADWRGDYAGTSWGKDSVTMLHLIARAGSQVPCVYMRLRNHRDNPDCEAVRDSFLARHRINYHERTFTYEDCQHGEHWDAIASEFGRRRMTALRADESTHRRMSIGRWGLDTGASFRPIGRWNQVDVFAYLHMHDLPVHPAYAMLGGGRWPREYIRVHSIGGERGSERGRTDWEREYYGDVLRRMEAARRPQGSG